MVAVFSTPLNAGRKKRKSIAPISRLKKKKKKKNINIRILICVIHPRLDVANKFRSTRETRLD